MVGVKDEPGYSTKLPSKIPVARRPTRKKPKDKPKRPLSAYNFFFKEEREKILKLLAGDDKDVENNPEADDYITPEALNKLRKDGGKDGGTANKSPKFEELGKLIGQRWKALPPDRLTKYSELASEDTERYKEEMKAYNGRQEAKMRDEALKPQMSAYPPQMKTSPSMMGDPPRGPPMPPGYDAMGAPTGYPGAPMGYGGAPPGAGGYPPMDSYGYATSMYGGAGGAPPAYAAYPTAGMNGAAGGGYPPNMMGMMPPPPHEGGPPPGPYDMGGGAAAMYPQSGAYMGYGGPPGGYPPMDPSAQGMYGSYGGAAGNVWGGQQ